MASDESRNVHRSSLSAGGGLLLGSVALSIVAEGVRISRTLTEGVRGPVVATEPIIATLAVVVFVWLLFFYFWALGALRVYNLSRHIVDGVFIDAVVNYRLASDLERMNAVLGVSRGTIWGNGYITVVGTRESLDFYSRAFRPRLLCSVPAELIQSVGIQTLEFPTRTVTRYFPAIFITPQGRAEGFTIGMLPMRWSFLLPRKLNEPRLRHAVDDLAARLGAAPQW